MGNWARQGDLNDKLGGAVKINSSDNYWPTKSQILNNWNAEVSGTYADNQWCDIDTVKEGSVDIYKRFYEYTMLLYDELFEDIVGPKKCDICLVSGGGASGKWSGWGSGFGGPGGGGQVLSVLDIYFEHLYKPGAYAVMTPGVGGVNEVSALTSMFHLYYTSPTANKDFFRNTYVGGKGSRGLGGLSTDTQKNTNGKPGPGGSGIVYQMTYTNPNTGEGATLNTRKTYGTNRNTAYFWESRQGTYSIPGGWEDTFAIPEFGEDDITKAVTHGAPGHYLWHDKYRTDAGVEITRTPNKYISSCPFNNGGGALIINGKKDVQSENNNGGRGGGGAGGGAGGSDYNSGAYGAGYTFPGGDGAVIVRYKAKRYFPADKKWIFKLNVGNIATQTAYAFGILLEGKYFIYMGKDIKRDDGTTYKDAPIQKYLQTEYSGTTITWEKEVPADFHPTKIWLVVAKDSNTLTKDDVCWNIRAGATIISGNYLYKQAVKRFYLDNIRNDYQTCEDSIARYEKDNRSLSYIDITDVFKYYMPNNTTNEYRFQISTESDVTRALRCASSLLPEGVKPFGIKSISAVVSGTSIAIISSVFGDIGFRDKTGEMCYLFELRVGNRDSYKPGSTTFTDYFEITFTFDVPTGYKLKFNENVFLSTGYGTILSTTNNSITIKYDAKYFHPNTDKRHCDFGHVFGEYGCIPGATQIKRTIRYAHNHKDALNIPAYEPSLITILNQRNNTIVPNKRIGFIEIADILEGTTYMEYQFSVEIDDYESVKNDSFTILFQFPTNADIRTMFSDVPDGQRGAQNQFLIIQPASNFNPTDGYKLLGKYWGESPSTNHWVTASLQYDDYQATGLKPYKLKSLKAIILNNLFNMSVDLQPTIGSLIYNGTSYFMEYRINLIDYYLYINRSIKFDMEWDITDIRFSARTGGSGNHTYNEDGVTTYMQQSVKEYDIYTELSRINLGGYYDVWKSDTWVKRRFRYYNNMDVGLSIIPFGIKEISARTTGVPFTTVPVTCGAATLNNSDGFWYIDIMLNTTNLDFTQSQFIILSMEFKLPEQYQTDYCVKFKNVEGAQGLFTYQSNIICAAQFSQNRFNPTSNYDVLLEYYVDNAKPVEPDYKVYLRSTGQYAAAILFKAGYQPDRNAGTISYFQILLPNVAGDSISSPLTYNKSGTKGIRVNTDAGQTETVTFGDTIYVYVHPPGSGNNNYLNVAIIQLQGLEDIQYVDI